ncbi:MAG: protein kinase domain-containing protein [Thermodesulfobacteriota bacterium]
MMNQLEGFQIFPGVRLAERYEIVCILGRGPASVVYLARDVTSGRATALKVVARDVLQKTGALNIILLGACTAKGLQHRNIVRFYEMETWNDIAFVTMEYVPCGNLSHLMATSSGHLTGKTDLMMLRQTAAALDYAHRAANSGFHGALSPANILFGNNQQVKIADFGIARRLQDLTGRRPNQEGYSRLAYRAPEQIRDQEPGAWTDVYALAAITYELLSGKPPFHGPDAREQILCGLVTPIRKMPAFVNHALSVGLAQDPSRRPVSAGEFVSLLTGEKTLPQRRLAVPVSPVTAAVASDRVPAQGLLPQKTAIGAASGKKKIRGIRKTSWPGKAAMLLGALMFLCWLTAVKPMAEKQDEGALPLQAMAAGESPQQWKSQEWEQSPEGAMERLSGNGTELPPVPGDKDHPVQTRKSHASRTGAEIRISSIPSGAEVFLDGKCQGSTPLRLEKLALGSYEIAVRKPCFVPARKRFHLAGTVFVEAFFPLRAACGKLTVESYPAGASWYLNELEMGTTPGESSQLAEGTYSIRLRKDKYRELTVPVFVSAGKERIVAAKLALDVPEE